MDLKDVVKRAKDEADEAYRAFHAGQSEKAEHVLHDLRIAIGEYFGVPATPAGEVTETATSEKPDGPSMEKPAEVPGESDQPALPATQFLGANVGQVIQGEKQTQ